MANVAYIAIVVAAILVLIAAVGVFVTLLESFSCGLATSDIATHATREATKLNNKHACMGTQRNKIK